MPLITVKESHYSADLMVLKSRLESEGISCFVNGELTSQVLSHIPSMSAKLLVSKNDFKRVKDIMVEIGEWPEEKSKTVCPNCGSERTKLKLSFYKKLKLFFSVLIALLTYVPVGELYKNARYQYKRCEFEF